MEKKKTEKIVCVTFIAKVIVNEGADEGQIGEAAKTQIVNNIINDLGDNLEQLSVNVLMEGQNPTLN